MIDGTENLIAIAIEIAPVEIKMIFTESNIAVAGDDIFLRLLSCKIEQRELFFASCLGMEILCMGFCVGVRGCIYKRWGDWVR